MTTAEMKALLEETHKKLVAMGATNGDITNFGTFLIVQNVKNGILYGNKFTHASLNSLVSEVEALLRLHIEPTDNK